MNLKEPNGDDAMTSNYLRVLCVVTGFQVAAAAQSQSPWIQVATTGPYARAGSSMAYDSQRGRTVLFGGHNSNNYTTYGDTWEWDGSSWQEVVGNGPPPSQNHAMAYDSHRNRIVLVNGNGNGNFVDTWEFDGSTWIHAAAVGPSGRVYHAIAYDAAQYHVVCFGGVRFSPLNDTWTWNGAAWQLQVPATSPPAREGARMAYDSIRGATVMFGGAYLSDTWEWSGLNWIQRAIGAPGPVARVGHAMTFDSVRRRVIMLGGWNGNALGDMWLWNGTSWTQASSSLVPHYDHAMAYDSQRNRTVLFGGSGYIVNTIYGDTWERYLAVPSTATSFGTGCGNPSLLLSPSAGAPPVINTTAQVAISNIPSSLAFVALGWSRTAAGPFPLPFPLAGYGMPGCYMLQSTEAAAQPVTFTGPGNATYSLPLPNWSGLVGLHLYLQGWAAAPGANLGGTIVSNGIEWVIGSS